ncbi:MAG: phosphotransferase [Chthoniobacterales bacterium]
MLSEEAITHTKCHFPAYAQGELEVTALQKGGSGRKFYRLRSPRGETLILVKYTSERQENSRYVDIASFLSASSVSVPAIYRHAPEEGLIWMQDLGETDLWAFRNESWSMRRPLYEKALQEVARLHGEASIRHRDSRLELEKAFNEELYLWEQNYFFQNCLESVFGVLPEIVKKTAAIPKFSEIAHRLANESRVLIHRDFQSQNILVHDEKTYLIDFQGMRSGLAQYDLASLLFDPYVPAFSESELADLLSCYKEMQGITSESFDEIFYQCALQRLMQALGAYGFLGLQKGKPEFLKHVSPACRNLKYVVKKIEGLQPFYEFLESLTESVSD